MKKPKGLIFTRVWKAMKPKGFIFTRVWKAMKPKGRTFYTGLEGHEAKRPHFYTGLEGHDDKRLHFYNGFRIENLIYKPYSCSFWRLTTDILTSAPARSPWNTMLKPKGRIFTRVWKAMKPKGRIFTRVQEASHCKPYALVNGVAMGPPSDTGRNRMYLTTKTTTNVCTGPGGLTLQTLCYSKWFCDGSTIWHRKE